MRAAPDLSPSVRESLLTRRLTALALTVAAHLLLLLLLLRLAPPILPRPIPATTLSIFDVAPPAPKAAPRPRAVAKSAPPPPKAPVVPPLSIAPVMPALIPGLETFDLADVRSSAPRGDAAGTRGEGESSASTYGPSDGPGGVRLYNAEWVREPTNAELAFYLPDRRQTGWGMIACQTIARNRVDNCRELANEPPGSGLSRAIRQAAWQFQVRPPRIDGKPVVGAWVRIRIDYTEAGAEISRSRGR